MGALQTLPIHKTTDFTEVIAPVHGTGTIEVRRVTYSVPSRLKDERLRVHLYDDRLSCFLGSRQVIELPRVYAISKGTRARLINYKHLINSLVKKPQAFRFSQIREDILPTPVYKKIWQHLEQHVKGKKSCKLIVGLLSIAAKYDCEKTLGEQVLLQINQGKVPDLKKLEEQYTNKKACPPVLDIKQHSLNSYDYLLNKKEVTHA